MDPKLEEQARRRTRSAIKLAMSEPVELVGFTSLGGETPPDTPVWRCTLHGGTYVSCWSFSVN